MDKEQKIDISQMVIMTRYFLKKHEKEIFKMIREKEKEKVKIKNDNFDEVLYMIYDFLVDNKLKIETTDYGVFLIEFFRFFIKEKSNWDDLIKKSEYNSSNLF